MVTVIYANGQILRFESLQVYMEMMEEIEEQRRDERRRLRAKPAGNPNIDDDREPNPCSDPSNCVYFMGSEGCPFCAVEGEDR